MTAIVLGARHISAGALAPGAAPPPATADLPLLLAGRLLVQGNSGAGKSWLLRRLLEEAYGLVQQAVIDPDGEFATLADGFDYAVLSYAEIDRVGGGTLARHMREHRYSAVLDLSDCSDEDRMRVVADFCAGLVEVEAALWRPLLVAIDEAQVLAPHYDPGDVDREIRRRAISAIADVMGRGRKRGLAGIIATQRLAETSKAVIAKATNCIVGRTIFDRDLVRAGALLGFTEGKAAGLRGLADGEFMATGPAFGPKRIRFKAGPTKTLHQGKAPALDQVAGIDAAEAKARLAQLPSAAAEKIAPFRRADAPDPETAIAEAEAALRAAGHTIERFEGSWTINGRPRHSAPTLLDMARRAQNPRLYKGNRFERWSETELSIVAESHRAGRTREQTLEDLTKAGFGRTLDAVIWAAKQLGLTAWHPWSESEIAHLRHLHGAGKTPLEIATILGRPIGGVHDKCFRLGLKFRQAWTDEHSRRCIALHAAGKTLGEIAEDLGRPYMNVAKMTSKLGLRFALGPRPKHANGHLQ